jgi:violaxanthin de-epoxidase
MVQRSNSAVSDAFSGLCGLLVLGSTVLAPLQAAAADNAMADVGTCLLQKCQKPLARCVSDPVCAANLLCIQTCAGKPDEGNCQIRCGDEFSNDVVGEFTKCAVTTKKCVPQRQDDGSWPVPKNEALVAEFSPSKYTGSWYISAGLNKAFDTFDCQLHKFESPADNKLVGNLQWRIKDPVAGTNFVTRYTVQEFVQDPKVPGIMYNHDNEFLHYQDDWYVVAQKEDAYFVVYYRGTNDAWDGYGGAFVYSREPKLPKKYYGEIDSALSNIGLRLEDFTMTDNSCRAAETRLEELKNDLVFVETRAGAGISSVERSLEKELEKDINAVENELGKDIRAAEDVIVKDEQAVERFFGKFFRK